MSTHFGHFKGLSRQILAAILVALLLFVLRAHSQTPWQDIKPKLSIEIGDGNEDFSDEEKPVEKGRFVTYKLEITNAGTDTHSGLNVLMEAPDYMAYVAGSTTFQSDEAAPPVALTDIGTNSPLALGYAMEDLYAGATAVFTVRYQVQVPASVLDDPLYTLAWANVLGKYSVTPTVSNLIETKISGQAAPILSVVVEPFPAAGQPVNSGFNISYQYKLHNVGGLPSTGITFKTYLPNHTSCVQDCGPHQFATLAPDEEVTVTMKVLVDTDLTGVTQIINTGYDLTANEIKMVQNRDAIIHPVGSGAAPGEGDFVVNITQVPNIILNSANGAARPDKADLSETVYDIWYAGRHQPYTYPMLSSQGSYTYREGLPCSWLFPHHFNTYTYAYNSTGGGCDGDISGCPPTSAPIALGVQTTLPNGAPKLVFTKNTTSYLYAETSPDYAVNNYMRDGGTFELPRIFTESRAVENGANGIVSTSVNATVSEDRYQYVQYSSFVCTYGCGKHSTCSATIPMYHWEKVQSVLLTLSDQDSADVTVYTSTAWLKTQGGHIGTNSEFTNNSLTDANYVDLGNPVIKPNFLTPSDTYTPPGESNGDYMIFGKNGTGDMQSKSGDVWKVTGTDFPFLEKGDAYDRANNPRDYTSDLLDKQKYGTVKTDALPSALTGMVDIGDGLVWHQTGDLTIGEKGEAPVVFSGGQSRIYVDGDVYIKANVTLQSSSGQSYNDITSLRIDAKNIYVDGSVTDLEVMLLARESFHSGVSKNQLRVLGDVIAKNAFWEREPLDELKPTEFNKPSEYIIEDMRKYVVPVPGDTTVPDDYNIWRQVNPATGETLDAY